MPLPTTDESLIISGISATMIAELIALRGTSIPNLPDLPFNPTIADILGSDIRSITDIVGTGNKSLTDIEEALEQILSILTLTNAVVPRATLLVSEFFTSEDLDGGKGSGDSALDFPPLNSSVYGKIGGFQIDESDQEFPIILQSVHQHPEFQAPSIVLTWDQFLAS